MFSLSTQARASYVIQVTTSTKKKNSAILGAVQIWRKRGSFGNIEEILRVCPTHGCKGVLKDEFALTPAEEEFIESRRITEFSDWPEEAKARQRVWNDRLTRCPRCSTIAVRRDFADTYGFQTTPDRIAAIVEGFFNELDRDADIYMTVEKYRDALRIAKARFDETKNYQQYSQELERARQHYQVFYPLKKIVKDMAAGASLLSRIKALITA